MRTNQQHPTIRSGRHHAKLALLVGAGVLASSPALAGGLLGYEIGTGDVGLASAGWGARAQDASTVFTNVAGMTRLDGDQALGGLQLLYGDVSFSSSSADRLLGTDNGGNAAGWFGGASGFYTHSLSRDLKVGIGLAGNFGAKLSYTDDWIGRYYGRSVTLIGLNVLPSVAYRLDDHWSVGASLNAMPTRFKDQTAINNLIGTDGQLEYKDTQVGWGGNVGVLYESSPSTRVGFSYNSEVHLTFSDTPTFSGLGPLISRVIAAQGITSKKIDIHANVPQQFMLSGFQQLNDRLAVLASVGWQQWSQFGNLEVSVDLNNPRVLNPTIPFKNSWHGALGVQTVLSGWTVNAGIAYDSAFQDKLLTPALPANDAWRFGVGTETEVSKGLRGGVAIDYLYGGSPDFTVQKRLPVLLGGRGSFSGTYSNEYVIYVASYLSYKF